jgi:uncharacterized repeat protein (TIGR01451 family)
MGQREIGVQFERFLATAPGTFKGSLHVAGAPADLNGNNDSASFTVTAVAPADIGLSASQSKGTASTGDKVTYSAQVSNRGPADATNVVLTDLTTDPNLMVSGLSSTQGSCTSGGPNIRCAIGTMVSGAKVGVSFAITTKPPKLSSTI